MAEELNMTQEEKQLLLIDLCARLPYGVKVRNVKMGFDIYDFNHNVKEIKTLIEEYGIMPYLRPMSSMTEEERKDILQSLNIHGDIDNEGNLLLGVECDIITLKVCKKYLGELNKRMFDVCHMIEKGLAIEAPEGMYKTE